MKNVLSRTERIRTLICETEESVEIILDNFPDSCSFDTFSSLGIIKDGIYKRLEYCLKNILHICSIINRDLRLGVPGSDDDTLKNLIIGGVIDEKMGELLYKIKGFRNILVHQYGKIDDILSFCAHINRYLDESDT